MIVAVDFDGTLSHSDYPAADNLDMKGIGLLKEFRANGGKVILWTCRHGEALDFAVESCHKAGLDFDAINENESEHLKQWQENHGVPNEVYSPKVYADLYIDDKSLIGYKEIPWDEIREIIIGA